MLEVHGGRSYRFDFLDEWPTLGGSDSVRMFLLSPLPDGAFARLVELISPHCRLSLPYWVPSWWHLDAGAKSALDAQVDAISASAGTPRWAVAGHFRCGQPLRVRQITPSLDRTAEEWADLFGLPRPAA